MVAFETAHNKQYKNNPLKDISNQPTIKQNESKKSHMPFEIAPQQAKINNFFDFPLQSTKNQREKFDNQHQFQHQGMMTARISELSSLTKNTLEDEKIPNSKAYQRY